MVAVAARGFSGFEHRSGRWNTSCSSEELLQIQGGETEFMGLGFANGCVEVPRRAKIVWRYFGIWTSVNRSAIPSEPGP